MSVKDGKDYLYLVWKCESTRQQYVVGLLSKNGGYIFRYGEEINEAIEVGFKPLIAFSNLKQIYIGQELFPAFSSRLPDRKRKDIDKILNKYGLDRYDPYELLKKSGGRLPIDNLQFIDPILDREKGGEYKFYLAGARHYLGCDGTMCNKAVGVCKGEKIYLIPEADNHYDKNAIRVENDRHQLLGYVPRYYTTAYLEFIREKRVADGYVASVCTEKMCDECIEIKVTILARG